MTWLFRRETTGLQYTSFEFDQEEDRSCNPYIPFVEGRAPLMPVDYIESARQVKQANGRLPDVLTVGARHVCNDRFRDLVESFEPGVHFFHPITLRRKNGEILGPHYLWTVGRDVDCILTEGLDQYYEDRSGGLREFDFFELENDAHFKRPKENPIKITVSKPAIAGLHLWTGGMLGFDIAVKMFMSDEFYSAWRKGQFTNLDFRSEVKEIDKIWRSEENMGEELGKWQKREQIIAECWPETPKRHW